MSHKATRTVNWGTTAIGAGSGLLIGGLVGGAPGALIGAVGGGALGYGIGELGKKSPNPGLPLYVNGKEAPEDLYDLLKEIYLDDELFEKYSQEEALPPTFLIPREGMDYIIQRYSGGNVSSKYHARGKLLCIDSISLLVTCIPEYEVVMKYLHAVPLAILAVEYILDSYVTDEELRYILQKFEEHHGEPTKIYRGEGLYRELEYHIVVAIGDSIKKYMGDEKKINYRTILNAILRNHSFVMIPFIEAMHDEFLLDKGIMEELKLREQEVQRIEEYRQSLGEGDKTYFYKRIEEVSKL